MSPKPKELKVSMTLNRGDMDQQNPPFLIPELWAKVFGHLEQRPDHAYAYNAFQHSNQAEVHRLKLVCKQFRSICESHTDLVQRLHLNAHFSVALVPSLLAWLHQNKGSLKVFWSDCTNPLVDIVMAGLFPAPNMNAIGISDVSACTVSLVGVYKSLERCTLVHVKAEHVGLAPLGALPKLRQLMLQGNFDELHHLTGLSALDCVSSHVLGALKFPPALRHLAITDSDLVGVHAQTLPACTALTQLMLDTASLKGNNAYVYLDRGLSVVPTNIGQLTQLRTLHLSTDMGSNVRPAELSWVFELTSLQELSMSFNAGNADMLQHVSMLTKLTCLDITGFEMCILDQLLDVNVKWHKLQALSELFIHHKRLLLGDNFHGLLQLPKLQEVSFKGSFVHGSSDINCFDALISEFTRLRPHVKSRFSHLRFCKLNGTRLGFVA